jgi:ATP-dependent DNA helicase RecG
LAIAYFGSLDLSILDEMPKNRKPIVTKAVAPEEQEKIYDFIRSEIKKGRQAFIIFPLVTESQILTEVKAATEEHKRLSENIFPEFNLGLMHGKLKPREKEEVMMKFKNKKHAILVSTSVVEVGVDVPNATAMIIENAERFGLSQLHQFRGRVGRGVHQSYCFLFSGSRGQKSLPPTRLKILEKTNNGFEIAEQDLKLRGPGQFFGTLQSGLPDIAMENLNNIKLIKFAREEAQEILKSDPQLKNHPDLREALQKFSKNVHLE